MRYFYLPRSRTILQAMYVLRRELTDSGGNMQGQLTRSRASHAAPSAKVETCCRLRNFCVSFVKAHRYADLIVLVLEILLIPAAHMSCTLALRAGCAYQEQHEDAEVQCFSSMQMPSFRPALFLGAHDQAVVRDFPCRSTTFGRTLYTLLRLYPLCLGYIWPLEAAEPLFVISLMVCLLANCLLTAALKSGSALVQRPASDPGGDSHTQRCEALRHCFVAAVRLSLHGGYLLTVLQLWWRYGKQTGVMLLSLGSGKYYLPGNRFQIILFCLIQDVGPLKMPMELHVPLALLQTALAFATAVTWDLMTVGSVQQPFQTLIVMFCSMVVVPTAMLCILERPLRQAYGESCSPQQLLQVNSIIDKQAGFGEPEAARASPRFSSRLLQQEEPAREKALMLVRQQSVAGDRDVGNYKNSAAVICGDGGNGIVGVDATAHNDELAEVPRCNAGIRTGLDDTVTGGGSTYSTSSAATVSASCGDSGISSGYGTTVCADAATSISGVLPLLCRQSRYADSVSSANQCIGSSGGSSGVGSPTHGDGAGDEPELCMCAAEIMEPHAREEIHQSVYAASRVGGLMPCDGTCRLHGKTARKVVDVTAAASSAAPTPRGTAGCRQPQQLQNRPRRPVLDLRLLKPAQVACGGVDLHGAGEMHPRTDCSSSVRAGCGGQQLAAHEGRGAAVTAAVGGSAGSADRGSNLLYISRLSSCVMSVKVDTHHFAGGEGFPQAAAALSGAARGAVRAHNAAALSAALRSSAVGSGDVLQPGRYSRNLIRTLGNGAVVRGCVHLIHVVRFPRSFHPHAPNRRLQLPLLPHDLEDGDAEPPCVEAVASNVITTAEDAYTPVGVGDILPVVQSQRRGKDPTMAAREVAGVLLLPKVAAFGDPTAAVPPGGVVGLSSGLCGSGDGYEVRTRGLYGSWRVSESGSSSHGELGHWSPFSGERYAGSAAIAHKDGGAMDPWDEAFAGGPSSGGVRLIHIEIAAGRELSASIDTAQTGNAGGGGAVGDDVAAEPERSLSPREERQWSAVRDAHSGPLDGGAGGAVGSMVSGGMAWQPLHNFISIADPVGGGSGISGVNGSADESHVSRSMLRPSGSITQQQQQQQQTGYGYSSFDGKVSESLTGRKPLGERVGIGPGVQDGTAVGFTGVPGEPSFWQYETSVTAMKMALVLQDRERGTAEQRINAPGGEDAGVVTSGVHDLGSGAAATAASGSRLDLQTELLKAYEQAAIAASLTAATCSSGLATHSTKSLDGSSGRGGPVNEFGLLDSCSGLGGLGGGEELLPCYLDSVAMALSEGDCGGARPNIRVVLSPKAVAAIAELQLQAAQAMDTDVRHEVSELRVRVVVARASGGGDASSSSSSSSAVLDEPQVPLQPLQLLPRKDQEVEEQQEWQRQKQQMEGGHAHSSTWPAACLEVELPTGLLSAEAVGGATAVFVHLLAPREAPSDGSGHPANHESHKGVASGASDELEPESPIRGSVLPALWLLRRAESSTAPSRQGGAGCAGPGPGTFTPVRVLQGHHNRAKPLLLVADHAVAEELRVAYDEHATAIFFDSGATEEDLQPHLPYSGSRLMAYCDHMYDMVTDIAELLAPPFPSSPDPSLAEAAEGGADSEALADLATTEAITTGEQLLSYMCGRGMWASAQVVVGLLRERWGVEVGGAEAFWTAASAPAFFAGASSPQEAQAEAVGPPGSSRTALNDPSTHQRPPEGAVADTSAIGESPGPPYRACIMGGGRGSPCEEPGARSADTDTCRVQAGLDGGDNGSAAAAAAAAASSSSSWGHAGIPNGYEARNAFRVARMLAQIICAVKFATVAAVYCYVLLQSGPQTLPTVMMWRTPFIAVSVALVTAAFLSGTWSVAWGLLLDGLLLGAAVMTREVLSVLPVEEKPMLQSADSAIAYLGSVPSSSGPALHSAMVLQVLLEPAALLGRHPQAIAALMALRALAYVCVSVHWLDWQWTAAVGRWTAAALGNLLVAHWLRRSYHR